MLDRESDLVSFVLYILYTCGTNAPEVKIPAIVPNNTLCDLLIVCIILNDIKHVMAF